MDWLFRQSHYLGNCTAPTALFVSVLFATGRLAILFAVEYDPVEHLWNADFHGYTKADKLLQSRAVALFALAICLDSSVGRALP